MWGDAGSHSGKPVSCTARSVPADSAVSMPRAVPRIFVADQSACQECARQSLSFLTSCSKSLDEISNALKNHLGGSPRNRPLNTCCDSFFSGSKFALMPRGNQPIRIGRKRSPNIIQCRELLLDRHLIYRIFHHWHSLAPSLYASYYSIISRADESGRTIRAIKTAAHRPRRDCAAASHSSSSPQRPDPYLRRISRDSHAWNALTVVIYCGNPV